MTFSYFPLILSEHKWDRLELFERCGDLMYFLQVESKKASTDKILFQNYNFFQAVISYDNVRMEVKTLE